MKIGQNGPAYTPLAQSVQNDRPTGSAGRQVDSEVSRRGKSATVELFSEGCKIQRIGELAHTSDRLRAEKAKRIKEQIEAGQYQVDSKKVAKSIARSEVSRLLEKK